MKQIVTPIINGVVAMLNCGGRPRFTGRMGRTGPERRSVTDCWTRSPLRTGCGKGRASGVQ